MDARTLDRLRANAAQSVQIAAAKLARGLGEESTDPSFFMMDRVKIQTRSLLIQALVNTYGKDRAERKILAELDLINRNTRVDAYGAQLDADAWDRVCSYARDAREDCWDEANAEPDDGDRAYEMAREAED